MTLTPNSNGEDNAPLREMNTCHTPGGSAAGGQFCAKDDAGVPKAPGTTPIPPGMIRAYHYTNKGEPALQSILKTGLSTQFAKGESYGEPSQIWLSTHKPADFKFYVEVFVKPEELDGGVSPVHWYYETPEGWKPANTPAERQIVIDRMNNEGANFTLGIDHLPVSRIVTYSEPWMPKYHEYLSQEYKPYIKEMIAGLLRGEFDNVAATNPTYAKLVPALKKKFGPKK